MPILGSHGANTAILDAIDFADYLAAHGTENIKGFYGDKYEGWQKEVKDFENRLAEMHSKERSSL